jgi:hypothetical protein
MLLEQTEENTNSNNLEIAPLSFLVLVFCRIATIENGRSRGFIYFHLLPSLDTIIANQPGGGVACATRCSNCASMFAEVQLGMNMEITRTNLPHVYNTGRVTDKNPHDPSQLIDGGCNCGSANESVSE